MLGAVEKVRIQDKNSARLNTAREQVVRALLAERNDAGHWIGELSTSALSTATAVTALALVDRHEGNHANRNLIVAGLQWLATHANTDGGWGDTVRSHSNISTTTLVWAAFGMTDENAANHAAVIARAEQWLVKAAGALDPESLSEAIAARYGKDRTFSVPILTMCALAGRLGARKEAWQFVRQLPFELALLPHQVYGAARLPVVSYALPALIAIGQVRHHFAPTRNPATRLVRDTARKRTLRILESIQPENGGFLEATPLTSFVTMSLAAMGLTGHRVTRRGVEFLRGSARPDGSWAIDTNLATWVTTLSVNAIPSSAWPREEQTKVLAWLVNQQYRVEHPYTHAAPGGWAWTDLPGGVPDADDTAGALLAVYRLSDPGNVPPSPATICSAAAGVEWLLNLQNRDGGIPTFCRGWGALAFDRSSPDLTAHALRAWLVWRQHLPALRSRIDRAVQRAIRYLAKAQRSDGAWIPLWFGHQDAPDDENPLYGTTRVLVALADCERAGIEGVSELIAKSSKWLIEWQSRDGGWNGARTARSSVEETSLALEALASLRSELLTPEAARALQTGLEWLLAQMESGPELAPSPIGFYFARLWYYERLYPRIFAAAALAKAQAL